jgi:hypothetical protein
MRTCAMVSAETPAEAGAKLADRLHADRVI